MSDFTRPIKVIFNTKDRDYRLKTWPAYLILFTLMAGDAVRYSIGWWGWGTLLVLEFAAAIYLLFRFKGQFQSRFTWPLLSVLGLMALSIIWSAYPAISLLALVAQLGTTAFAYFFATLFDWRHLLRIFGNTIRFILFSSGLFELFASLVARGPIAPIFKNYEGDEPPAAAYYWTQGNLFEGERIQGIVGNSNLLAYVAMVGIVVFSVEIAIIATKKWLGAASLVTAVGAIWLAKSAGVGFALAAVAISAVVSIAAEGKDRETRHFYYRIAWASAGTVAVFVLLFRAQVFEAIGKSPDMTGRSGIWKKVLELISERPLQGWGWISHWVPGVEPYEGLVVIKNVPYYQAHNAYLDVAMQLGLIGAAIFAVFLLITFVKLWRLAVRHTNSLYLWPILTFMGLAVWSLTESRLLIESGWLILAMFAIKVFDPEDNLESRGRTPKRVRLLSRGLLRSRLQQRKDR